jgi:hypothetical protein
MMKSKFTATTLSALLVLSMVALTIPRSAYAENKDEETIIRLRANPGLAPMGKLFALGAVAINGKTASGDQTLWGGEMLQSFAGNASVNIDALGQMSLKRGAVVRLATASSNAVLVASLLNGDLNVRLQAGVCAYIQACDALIRASSGASFRVSVRDGHAVAEASFGTLETAQTAQRKFIVKPIGMGATNSVVARSTRQIQVQVTDENDKPVPDIPIIFALGSAGSGTLGSGGSAGTTLTVQTNAQGIAQTQYNAGDAGSSTEISATVEGTRYSWTGTFTAAKAAAGFWNPVTTTLVVAGAAAGVGLGVYYGTRNNNRDPINPDGNPNVRP